MADTAAYLVGRDFPQVPVRQWVLSLPFALRYRLAYDARLARDVLTLFVRTVSASLRRRASEESGKVLEQIDGVIEIDADIYLVEAKRPAERLAVEAVSRHFVRVFTRDYTRGILISATEYKQPAIETCRNALFQGCSCCLHSSADHLLSRA